MKNINKLLTEEICELETMATILRKRISNAPEGRLRISQRNGGAEYYVETEGACKKGGTYIRKRDKAKACELAQNAYDIKILKCIEERLSVIKRFLVRYEKTDPKKEYDKLKSYRRDIINDMLVSDVAYIRRWQEAEYESKEFAEGAPEIFTEKGERVRSKSEKIIADKLYALGIPYRYEYPITIGGTVLYPDFMILKMPEREEIYLEHLGMLDNEGYAENVLFKLDTYERNGYFLEEKLFFTHETGKNPLNTKVLDNMLRRIIL